MYMLLNTFSIVNSIFIEKNLSYLYFTPANLGINSLYNKKVHVKSSWIKQKSFQKQQMSS